MLNNFFLLKKIGLFRRYFIPWSCDLYYIKIQSECINIIYHAKDMVSFSILFRVKKVVTNILVFHLLIMRLQESRHD